MQTMSAGKVDSFDAVRDHRNAAPKTFSFRQTLSRVALFSDPSDGRRKAEPATNSVTFRGVKQKLYSKSS
jgi:hypothetical protein